MFDRILLPTDGTESMDAVVETAADIAVQRDAEVYVLYVIDDRAFLTLQDEMKSEVVSELEGEGEAATDRASTRLREAGIDVTAEIREGNPAEEILGYSEEMDADLITMGTRQGDYTKNMMGSVSQKVVARAGVPVLTTNLAAER
ncbi:universal stress protein [Halobellus clavatus]|jgi:nucleotide-binding universal stress UspA family protein|uniref:Nucleotide-binding universal stress protein, UspA family n=1 Tax=Halobellus clavatus TaxID=660517 RepID=A0A1H3F7V4_9EURY|nr:universal stress protein [Halobellus clavatus]SDX86229.1 Nucleotide-binding universal stress protein, UspA family [Halobellus clavatus]